MGNVYIVLGIVALAAAAIYRDELGQAVTSAAVNVREFIAGLEGFSSSAYPDAGGQSIGYGHQLTGQETTSDPEQLFSQDLAAAEAAVARLVAVPLSANQRAALISFVYNIGEGAFASSTLLRKLNAGDYVGAANEFDRWVYSGHTQLTALVERRAKEKSLFTS